MKNIVKNGASALILLLTLISAPLWAAPAQVAAKSEGDKFAAIAERYFQDGLTLNPLEGTAITGDAKYEDKLEISISPEHRAKTHTLALRVQRELAGLKVAALSPADKLSYDLLKEKMRDDLEGEQYPGYLMPLNQYGGLPVYVAQLGSGQQIQPLKTVASYRNFLKRLQRVPVWVDQAIANMKTGMQKGYVPPKALIERALPSLKALTDTDVEKNAFYQAIKVMPASFTPAEREELTKSYRAVVEKELQPAMQRFYTFVETAYLPKCRTTSGIGALPNGKAWYAYQVRHFTTTKMTPEEIHALGLKEVARIRGEMEKIQAHYQFKGTLTEFLKWADGDPQFKPFKTEKDVLDAYAELNKKIMAKLPDLFGRSPKAPLEIRAEPELTRSTASDHYSSPAVDGSRPGVFYAVIEDASKYSNTGMTTLFLHEGQPGHHYHIAMQQELPLPNFRRHGGYTAYTEGWALYAETLGHEMGLYDDPNAYLGHLNDELLRAVRLVTDTGLHDKGWTREQTIQYMMDTQGYSETESRRATERYMAWPGQALAYKIGALKIQELRKRAQEKLGARFSLKAYHDLVLSDGALPLTILEAKVDRWIAEQSK